MLLKLLITIAIVLAMLMMSRQRKSRSPAVSANGLLARYLSIGILTTSFLLAALWLGWRWVDGNQIMRVTISSSESVAPIIYQVRKRDIGESTILTIDGLSIRLSSNERITISSDEKR